MSIKTIVVTGMLFLAGTIVSGQTSTNQVKEKNMEKLEPERDYKLEMLFLEQIKAEEGR